MNKETEETGGLLPAARAYVPEFSFPKDGAEFSTSGYMIHGISPTYRDMVVEVYQLLNGQRHLLGMSKVSDTYKWGIITFARWGTVTLVCKFQGFADESAPITYKATYVNEPVDPPIPVIQKPASNAVEVLPLYISGIKTYARATVEILKDLGDDIPLGSVEVTGQSWTVKVDALPPGPVSLVAEQIKDGVRSGRSVPRAFRMRPPTLKGVSSTRVTATTVRFYGSGYYDERLETQIQLKAFPGTIPTPPNAEVLKDGSWETYGVWPFGMYQMAAIQKIADNSGGWIDSPEFRFTVHHVFPDTSEEAFTENYLPVFSGKGLTGASIRFCDSDRITPVAPDAQVINDRWSSAPLQEWGPSYQREVHIRQYLGDQFSKNWAVLIVNIPPRAPDLDAPIENGQSPQIRGKCWPGAVVTLEYNNDGVKHKPVVTNGTWTFRRPEPFAPGVTNTFSVIQTAASQDSLPAAGSFTVRKAMLKPEITVPLEGAEVGRNTLISGTNGMSGATMTVRDAQMGSELNRKLLLSDGDWSIELNNLEYRGYSLDAMQILDGIDSPASEPRNCQVVLEPPIICVPAEGGDLPRRSTLSGTGWPFAQVTVWLEGRDQPLLRDVQVNAAGEWSGQISLDQLGHHGLCAQQTFTDQVSRFLQRTCRVVPSVPFIESPIRDAAIGSAVVISGFGYPGDSVTVTLASGAELGVSQVLEEGSWSLTAHIEHPGGTDALIVVASRDEYDSPSSEPHPLQINTWLPTIDEPAAGRWVDQPVVFAGQGKDGVGQVVSWFNPDVVLAANLSVIDEKWRGEVAQLSPSGGNWCRFRQRFTVGADPAIASDWAESQRFEVRPPPLFDDGNSR